MDKKRLARSLISLLIAAIFLALIVRQLDWQGVVDVLRSSRSDLVAPVLALLLVHYALKGLRWRALLATETAVPALLAIRLTFVGFLMNNFLPARMGELGRPWLLTTNHPGVRFPFALATMLGVKLFDLMAVIICLLISSLLVPMPPFARGGILALSVACGLALATGLVAARWVRGEQPGEGRLFGLLQRVLGDRAESIHTSLLHFAAGLATMTHPRAFLVASAYTLVSFALLAAALLLCMEIVGVSAGLSHCVFVMGMIGIGFTIPAPPTAAGNYHFFASQALLLAGVAGPDAAFAFALVAHITQVLANSAGGLISLVGLDWRKLREADPQTLQSSAS